MPPADEWATLSPEAKRERLLTAAAEVFARQGLDAPMSEVAEAAGSGVASIYRRFDSKHELLAALVVQRMDQITDAARAARRRGGDRWLALTGMLHTLVEGQSADDFLGEARAAVAGHRDVILATQRATDALERRARRRPAGGSPARRCHHARHAAAVRGHPRRPAGRARALAADARAADRRARHQAQRRVTSPAPGRRARLRVVAVAALAVAAAVAPSAGAHARPAGFGFAAESLNGSANNRSHPSWGKAGSAYLRLTRPRYADGIGRMPAGPNPRYVSNRIFNSAGVDVFSARYVSQWAWVWGQFLDHTLERAKPGQLSDPIAVSRSDPLESYHDLSGPIAFTRDAAAPGTGRRGHPRRQVNTIASYLDASAVYGETAARVDWLRVGPDNGRAADAGARLMLPGGYLPRADARGHWRRAPHMDAEGMLASDPRNAMVAGDVRANDNAELTAVQTLFAREHNRIVGLLPRSLSPGQRFQIARRVVAAEQQYITYTQFLPAMGVSLPTYRGYRPSVDAEISDEFATIGYRAHSMVNGELDMVVPASRYGPAALARLEAMGVQVGPQPATGRLRLTLSQDVAFFNPAVLPAIGLAPMLRGLAEEPSYANDAQLDDSLRSVLFEYPGPSVKDPEACFEDPSTPGCYRGVTDLGAIDLQRERDHGMPTYNQLRRALGLAPQTTFTQVTGERTDRFPADLGSPDPIDDPHILDALQRRDVLGRPIAPGSSARAVSEVQRTTLAARLKAIYGSVGRLDAFVGMLAEPHVRGSELGPLQLALWRRQFDSLRDGDRFFYGNDPVLARIQRRFGITYRHTLGQLITLDAGVPARNLPRDVFFAPLPPRG